MDVDVPLAVHQIPGLGVGELGRTLEWAGKGLALLRDPYCHTGVFAGLGRAVEVSRGGGTGETRELPLQLNSLVAGS